MKIFFDALSLKPTTSIGTQAYIISGMQLISKKIPDAEFILLSVDPVVDNNFLKHTKINYKLIKRHVSKIGTWIQVRKLLKTVDVVVSSWGDAYISTPPHVLFRKALMLRRKSLPLILFTSSIGPFSEGYKKILAVKGLNFFDILTVRDSITYEYFKKLKLKNVKLVHDSAFALEPESEENVRVILDKSGLKEAKYIGLNISVLMYNLFKDSGRDYSREMADYASWLNYRFDLPIVLVPHQIYPKCFQFSKEQYQSKGGDDRFAISKVLELTSENKKIIGLLGEYTPMEMKGVIKGSEIFIGGRMHSVIAAVSTATPSLIMQYSHKAGGMMKFLKLEQNLWDINEPSEILRKKTEDLWSDKNRIREKLSMELPSILIEVNNLADLIQLEKQKIT